MINVAINGTRVSYDTLGDVQEASSLSIGLSFWRETVLGCLRDSDALDDLLNELWQSGGQVEAEMIDQNFAYPAVRRWTLVAIVLSGMGDERFGDVVRKAGDGDSAALIGWLDAARSQVQKLADVQLIKEELEFWRQKPNPQLNYLVVDLSAGPRAERYPIDFISDPPSGKWGNEYKTKKLVLRRIEAGEFMMGSPRGEMYHGDGEQLHRVTLTEPFYLGVFAMTQKQWALVEGNRPSFYKGEAHPVESVSYKDIRGSSDGNRWPTTFDCDADSFLGRFRSRTGCVGFDLPTEAQWECACRAGKTTSYSWGEAFDGKRANWSGSRAWAAHGVVGMYPPNAWGLYDMHGNIHEWCLDWYGSYTGKEVIDPVGPNSGYSRVVRGGSWRSFAESCRSACRYFEPVESIAHDIGFRLCCSAASVKRVARAKE